MQQRKYGRVLDTSKLPRYTFYHKLAEPEQNCKVCNCLLTAIRSITISTGLLSSVLEAAWKDLLAANYLQTGESPVKILKPEKTGYLSKTL